MSPVIAAGGVFVHSMAVKKAVLVLLALALHMMHFKFCERTAMVVFGRFGRF